MLQNFFEGNSISFEVFDLFDELCQERAKKSALRAVFRQMKEDYADEPGEYIIALMSVYYCGLKNHFEDSKFKKELESFTEEHILACFGEEEGYTVATVWEELLKTSPTPVIRKKIDHSNSGSKNWRPGDLYAYRLHGEEIEKAGLDGKYAIIYCVDIEKKTAQRNDVKIYVLLCEEKELKKDARSLLKDSFLIASFASSRYYLYLLVGPHHEYPTDELIYVGNSMEFVHPPKEFVFGDKICIPRMVWTRFSDCVAYDYLSTMKRLHGK